MKEYWNKRFSGVHGRIMKIVFVLTGILAVLIIIVTALLLHLLHVQIDKTELEERLLVEQQSQEAVMNLASDGLLKTITWEADQMDDEFWIMCHDYRVIGEQVKAILKNPSDYVIKDLQPPKMELDNTYSLQFLCPAGYNKRQ